MMTVPLCSSNRPNPPDVSAAVTSSEERGAEPAPVETSGFAGGGAGPEPESPLRRRATPSSPHDPLSVFQKRSIFTVSRSSSIGYFSFEGESLPSSPLSPRPATADRSTQTPSPSGQVMIHALQRMAHGGGAEPLHGRSSSSSQPDAAGVMQAETVGRELRRIGDEFNRLLLLRGVADGHQHVVIPPNQLPHIHQEPAMLLCLGLLLLVIGRMIYLQGSVNSPDHSQV